MQSKSPAAIFYITLLTHLGVISADLGSELGGSSQRQKGS